MHFDVEYPYASSWPWLRFPYIKMARTILGGYKRRPSPLIHTHHFGGDEEKGGLHLLELLSRVG
jgi:hypothetical protein